MLGRGQKRGHKGILAWGRKNFCSGMVNQFWGAGCQNKFGSRVAKTFWGVR